MREPMQLEPPHGGRVIGLDLHPDIFSAAALCGRDAGAAQVVQQWNDVATARLSAWGQRLAPGDLVVLEATGNAFEAAAQLRASGVQVVVLESQRAGQIRKTYCNNDRVSAVKLARIYLSGLAHLVWQPDERTRERRDVLHRHGKAVTDATRARNRLKSFLCEHGVRLKSGVRLMQDSGRRTVLASRAWSARQRELVELMLDELREAEGRRRRLAAWMAQDVASDPQLLSLMRLLGIRHVIAFAIGAVVGDVGRFPNPKKLVAYIGLAPPVDKSGNGKRGQEQLVNFGRKDLRSLLIQAAQSALRVQHHPLHRWGWKLFLRTSAKNLAVAAVARKLAVSIWYLLRGLFTPLTEIDTSLRTKLAKLATTIGRMNIEHLGYPSKAAFIEEKVGFLLRPT
jgi:transposase